MIFVCTLITFLDLNSNNPIVIHTKIRVKTVAIFIIACNIFNLIIIKMLTLVKILSRLGDRQHIVRERAAFELEDYEFNFESAEITQSFVNVMFSSQRWEDRCGAILACCVLANKA